MSKPQLDVATVIRHNGTSVKTRAAKGHKEISEWSVPMSSERTRNDTVIKTAPRLAATCGDLPEGFENPLRPSRGRSESTRGVSHDIGPFVGRVDQHVSSRGVTGRVSAEVFGLGFVPLRGLAHGNTTHEP